MHSWILASIFLAAVPTLENQVRRVHAHLLIDDTQAALLEAEKLAQNYPNSMEAWVSYLKTLAISGNEEKVLKVWDVVSSRYPQLMEDRQLLEEMGWGILKNQIKSTQYATRLSSLIGIYLTRDVRAVPILLKMMSDSNAIIRTVAIQMAADYADAPLKDKIEQMMESEKVWMVRLQIIQTAGFLRLKKLSSKLKTLVQSEKTMAEERHAAVAALVSMYDSVEMEEISKLISSNRAGLRHLGIAIATHFKVKEAKENVLKMLSDTHPDVRIAALNAVGLFYRNMMEGQEVKNAIQDCLMEADPRVAITASWVCILVDEKMGSECLDKWIQHPIGDIRRLAAGALARAGDRGIDLATKTLKNSKDSYVKVNVALGLIGQRKNVKSAADSIFNFLCSENKMWMWDTRENPLFKILAPSQIRHSDQIPNYPEAIDQMTRLNLVSHLAMIEDPRALDALKQFLQSKKINITGVAAAMLLQEGDESSLALVRELLGDQDPNIRLQACLVLAVYGKDETVLIELQKAYPGSDFETKMRILEAMGSIASPEAFSFLVGALKEPFPLLRIAAASSLIQSLHR